jgi:hypothetical protein
LRRARCSGTIHRTLIRVLLQGKKIRVNAQIVDTKIVTTQNHSVFVTGGTGYVGRPLIAQLLERGHEVLALVRPGSEKRLPAGCQLILGDALDGKSYAGNITPADTFVQLVGVSHPSPSKAAEFRSIDLASGRSAIEEAKGAGIRHFVYVSVAHPAPVMKAYIDVRSQCEAMITESGMNATILRPWYILGPGHRWPYLYITYLQADGIVAVDPRGCDTFGTGYVGTDGSCAGRSCRNSTQRSSNCRGSANPHFPIVILSGDEKPNSPLSS